MDEILAQLYRHGSLIVGFNVLLQQLGLPIPAVPTMMVAGALAAAEPHQRHRDLSSVGRAPRWSPTRCGSGPGAVMAIPVLRLLCRVSLSPDTCVRQTEGIFERWGFYSVVVSKFIPGFSTVAPPIAGALKMPIGAFVLASLASAGLWVGAAMGTGFIFARQIDVALAWMTENAALAAIGVGVLVGAYVALKAYQRWRLSRFVHAARISIDDLRAMLEQDPRPFVVDIGSKLAHQSRPHIPGAKLLDLDSVSRLADWPTDRDIVIYCACPNEESAKRAAQILLSKGFKRARPLIGGIDGWIAAGHPVEHGVAMTFAKAQRPAPSHTAESL